MSTYSSTQDVSLLSDEDFEKKVVEFVRNRDQINPTVAEQLLSVENIDRTHRILIALKRDLEHQFTAHRARLHEFSALVAGHRFNGDLTMEYSETSKGVTKTETISLVEAEERFRAKELRWKVRTSSFATLIESRLMEVSSLGVSNLLGRILSAVSEHSTRMEDTASEIDLELYNSALAIRKEMGNI